MTFPDSRFPGTKKTRPEIHTLGHLQIRFMTLTLAAIRVYQLLINQPTLQYISPKTPEINSGDEIFTCVYAIVRPSVCLSVCHKGESYKHG